MEYKALHSKKQIFLEYASIMPCFFRAISGSIDKKESLMGFHQALYT